LRATLTEPWSGVARGVVRDGAGCVVRVGDGVAVGDGDSSEALGSGIGNWSAGLNGTSPSAGGCTGGIACSRSRTTARLTIRPKATTMSTPARMTAAGMRNSFHRRGRSSSSCGGTAAPRRPVVR
jgi:hypothetical protein